VGGRPERWRGCLDRLFAICGRVAPWRNAAAIDRTKLGRWRGDIDRWTDLAGLATTRVHQTTVIGQGIGEQEQGEVDK
jgi:hypothetical protein